MPTEPYIVYGIVKDGDSNLLTSTNVIAHNTTTNEKTPAVLTTSEGKYQLDLANLTSGYSTGDSITVYVRSNGYVGDTTFTVSGTGGRLTNISTQNQIVLSKLEDRGWDVFKYILTTSYFTIDATLTNSFGNYVIPTIYIHSAMNDSQIESEGYPQITLYKPLISVKYLGMQDEIFNCDLSFTIEIYHNSAENGGLLADEIRKKIMMAQECWHGIGFDNLEIVHHPNDWWTEGKKKIHMNSFDIKFNYTGVIDI